MKCIQGLLILALLAVPSTGYAKAAVTESHITEQNSVSITVYNNNRGLIRDVRAVQLPVGTGELRFMDVAAHIIPVTVRARSMDRTGGFAVIEQKYEYDLMDANKLLDKYVGREITIVDPDCKGKNCRDIQALLLSNSHGQIFRI